METLLIALALAMDCFAVSVACAVIAQKRALPKGIMWRLALFFGVFQAFMPLVGWLLTSRFSALLEAWDHWIAFGMLAFIGGRMIADAFKKEENASLQPQEVKTELLLAIATSIDALAVGISYACTGYETLSQLGMPLLAIGLVSFLMSILGYRLGLRFGESVNKKMRPELLGGLILIGIGIKILVTHLGLFGARQPEAYIPPAPDYSTPAAWYVEDRQAPVDIFYISSTETLDWTAPGGAICHYAHAADTLSCAAMRKEMEGVDRRVSSGRFNYFSPYYRQLTLESYYNMADMEERFPLIMEDVRAAFKVYTEELNPDRPFILAGFSQGAQACVGLLKEMKPEVYGRLIATYALGWNISQADVDNCPFIRPATGATDTGVVVNYNSVASPEAASPIIANGNAVAINPVNWETDATPAVFQDSLTATLDPKTHLLLVDGYTRKDYVMPPLFPEGCYHTFEIRWYSEFLRQNMLDRTVAFGIEFN